MTLNKCAPIAQNDDSASIYLNNRNTISQQWKHTLTMYETCSKLAIKTPEQRQRKCRLGSCLIKCVEFLFSIKILHEALNMNSKVNIKKQQKRFCGCRDKHIMLLKWIYLMIKQYPKICLRLKYKTVFDLVGHHSWFTKKSSNLTTKMFVTFTLQAPIPQNGQTHSNNSSANCRQIVWVCLAILWNWRLKD